jgi:hypothetical protein
VGGGRGRTRLRDLGGDSLGTDAEAVAAMATDEEVTVVQDDEIVFRPNDMT